MTAGKNGGIKVGSSVQFAGAEAVVCQAAVHGGEPAFLIESGSARLPMWVPAAVLQAHKTRKRPVFGVHTAHVVAVDDFFDDPDEIRSIALAQEYKSDLRYFKGLRSTQRFLWPYLREEFGRLLATPVTEWLGHGANGCFQQTHHRDPLVWHHDTQSYAAAIYLTPDPPPGSGTSFWRDRTHGCRRRPDHALEQKRLGSADAVEAARGVVYDEYNLEHPDGWELVESVAGLYNRLVIWDASLIHSASTYEGFDEAAEATRLVQLFFFDI